MHRIDHVTAVVSKPAPQAAGTPGFFSPGDALTGQEATHLTSDWANDLQENVATAIEAAGIALVKGNGTQLLEAIMELASQYGLPLGVAVPFLGTQAKIPANCVPLMGQLVSRTDYPKLTAYVLSCGVLVDEAAWQANTVHRTKFSSGDGATTIRLPDLRGEAIYGSDLGRGVRTGDIGDWRPDETRAHDHVATAQAVAPHVHTGTTSAAPNHDHGGETGTVAPHHHDYEVPPPATDQDGQGAADGPSWLDLTKYATSQTADADEHMHTIAPDGAHVHTFTSDAAGGFTPAITIGSSGGAETRQRGTNYPFIMRIL